MSSKLYFVNPLTLVYPVNICEKREWAISINGAKQLLLVDEPLIIWALTLLPNLFQEQEAKEIWKSKNQLLDQVQDIWSLFVVEKIIVGKKTNSASIQRFSHWSRYGWQEALVYQELTRDYPFFQMNKESSWQKEDDLMLKYFLENSKPNIYQEFPVDTIVQFKKLTKDNLIKSYESINSYKTKLEFIFDFCFGERGKIPFKMQGSFLKKSIPSGGSRHPTEIFFISFKKDSEIKAGVYHYNVGQNSLDCIKTGNYFDYVNDCTFDLFLKFDKRPLGVVIFTSLFERSMWRYRDPRSFRAVLIDLGHAVMSFRELANNLGFDYYTFQKFKDSKVCNLIGIDKFKQSPFFISTIV